MSKQIPTHQLIDGLLKGNRLFLARAISRVENEAADATEIVQAVFARTGRAYLIGITGAPGTGKSTLVSALADSYRQAGLTVAVLAVDPSSPFSGGALLGDRVRMTRHSGDAGVFIRSMATRSGMGGLAKATGAALLLLDAAGFDRILVETVGVGQAEVEIASAAHTIVVVEAPGMGDEVQAIKAGLLEIADIFAVNKADRKGVERAVAALEMMLEMGSGTTQTVRHHGQSMGAPAPETDYAEGGRSIPVLKTVAISGRGVAQLREAIERHRAWLHESGALVGRDRKRFDRMLQILVQVELLARVDSGLPPGSRQKLVEQVRRRQIDPYSAAAEVVKGISTAVVSAVSGLAT